MKFQTRVLGIALLSISCAALASGGGGGGSSGGGGGSSSSSGGSSSGGSNHSGTSVPVFDPVLQAAQAAIDHKDWDKSQAILLKALSDNAQNADYHNLYAYSVRKSAHPNMDVVFSHYLEALRIDPKHLGAHEYLGEAYLQVNNLPKAREQLAALDKLCYFGCEAYSDLKMAVAKYEVQHPG